MRPSRHWNDDIALTENALSVLLGHNPGGMPRGKSIDALALPAVPAGFPHQLLERAARISARPSRTWWPPMRASASPASQYFPTISLTGLFGYVSEELDPICCRTRPMSGASAAPHWGRSLPVAGFRRQVRASEAVQRQALVGLHAERAGGLSGGGRRADQCAEVTRAAGCRWRRRVQALDDYARLARLRYDEGYASYIEVLDAQRFLFDAELEYVSSAGRCLYLAGRHLQGHGRRLGH